VIFSYAEGYLEARTRHFVFYFPDSIKDVIKDYCIESEEIYNRIAGRFNYDDKSQIVVYIDDSIQSRRGEADPFRININLNFFFDPREFTSFRTLFTHEMIHIINFKMARKGLDAIRYYLKLGFIPLWVFEGFSEYFSLGEDPFFLYESRKFPFYSKNEMHVFYSRDPYNRLGGYTQSYHMIRYLYKKFPEKTLKLWQVLSSKGNIYSYMRTNIMPFSVFFDELKNELSDLKKNESEHEFIFKGEDVTGLRIKDGKIYFLDFYDRHRKNKALFVVYDDSKKIILENIHSYCPDEKGNIFFSRLVKGKNGATYCVFKKKSDKIIKTDFTGIYPDIQNGFLTTSDGKGSINLYSLEDGSLIKSLKGFYSKLNNNRLYYFSEKDNTFRTAGTDDSKSYQIISGYKYTGFDIIFIEDNPYISIFKDDGFYLKDVTNDKLVRYYGGKDIFYHRKKLYFKKFQDGECVISCQKLDI